MTASVLLWLLLCLPVLVILLALRSVAVPQSLLHYFLPCSTSSSGRACSSPSSSSPLSSSPSSPCRVVVVGGSFAGLTFCRELLHRVPPPSGGSPAVAVTLVEPRQWFEYTPGVLRALVRPAHHPSLLTPLAHTTAGRDGRVAHVQGVCTALSSCAALVVVEGGEERWLPFDYCVLALGSGYGEHIKQQDTVASEEGGVDGAHGGPVLAAPCCSASEASSRSSSPSICPLPSSAPTIAQRLGALSSVHSALEASQEVLIVGAGLVGVVC